MTAARQLDCPQCGIGLAQRETHDVVVDYCPDCGGVWLDPGELGELVDERDHHSHRTHSSHHHHDHDDEFEEEFEEEYEEEAEESGGLLGFVSDAIGGGEDDEWEEGEDEWDDGGFDDGGEEF